MLNIKGIDISNWQTNINLADVKSQGYEVCYIKASEGTTYKDPLRQTHYNNAKTNNLKVGFYHFLHPDTDGTSQANFCYSLVKDMPYDCKMAIDIEITNNQSSSTINKCILDFYNRWKTLTGEPCVLYTYSSFVNEYINSTVSNLELWVAEYGVSQPHSVNIWGTNFVGWQYSDKGNFTGTTDLDVFNEGIYLDKNSSGTNSDFQVGEFVRIQRCSEKYATGENIPNWVKQSVYTILEVDTNRVLLKEIDSWVYNTDISEVLLKVGDHFTVKPSATNYATGEAIPSWVKERILTIGQVDGNRVLATEISSWLNSSDIELQLP